MNLSRRRLLLDTLFGAGFIGLRSLATGIPIAMLADPGKASAATVCDATSDPQFLLLSSSGDGDPLNANVPGTYGFADISHPTDPLMAPASPDPTTGLTWQAAAPWAGLPAEMLMRTCFFHHGTYTVVHPDLGKVMTLQGFVSQHEMLVSLLAQQLAARLGTVQPEPVALGPRSASEGITVGGRPQPILSPSALASLLSSPTGPLGQIQKIRDADLDRLNDWYRQNGNAAQKSFIDRYALSQKEARDISETLLTSLASIKDNSPDSQVTAALILFQMKVSPVISIHIPFGGDNHTDAALARETRETVAACATLGNLWNQLVALKMDCNVTFATMNVFGRTLTNSAGGRNHHGDHHVTVMMGKKFKGGVVGGIELSNNDYRATAIGSVPFAETLSAMGKTLGVGCGVSSEIMDLAIRGGQAISGATV